MPTKTQERLARQERARALREAERKAARRKRNLVITAVVAAVIVVAVAVGIGIGATRDKTSTAAGAAPKDAVTTGSAVAVGGMLIGKPEAPVTVDAYEDFTCPICGSFEAANGTTVTKLIQDGTINVRYHMMSFIDDNNGGTYSHRAANAFAAADQFAGPDKALALHAALYANQPDEKSSAGLPDGRIIELASQAGITQQEFVDAVSKMQFKSWVAKVADDASKANVTGTPTLFMNGKQVDIKTLADPKTQQFDPNLLIKAVDAAKSTPKQ